MKSTFKPIMGRVAGAIFSLLGWWRAAKIVPATFAFSQGAATIALVRQEKKSEMRTPISHGRIAKIRRIDGVNCVNCKSGHSLFLLQIHEFRRDNRSLNSKYE